jgi:hypothetical protein
MCTMVSGDLLRLLVGRRVVHMCSAAGPARSAHRPPHLISSAMARNLTLYWLLACHLWKKAQPS